MESWSMFWSIAVICVASCVACENDNQRQIELARIELAKIEKEQK